MFVKVEVGVNMMVEVDDKFADLATSYANGEWNEELAEECTAEIQSIIKLPTWGDIEPNWVGVPHILYVNDMDNNPMLEW